MTPQCGQSTQTARDVDAGAERADTSRHQTTHATSDVLEKGCGLGELQPTKRNADQLIALANRVTADYNPHSSSRVAVRALGGDSMRCYRFAVRNARSPIAEAITELSPPVSRLGRDPKRLAASSVNCTGAGCALRHPLTAGSDHVSHTAERPRNVPRLRAPTLPRICHRMAVLHRRGATTFVEQ